MAKIAHDLATVISKKEYFEKKFLFRDTKNRVMSVQEDNVQIFIGMNFDLNFCLK